MSTLFICVCRHEKGRCQYTTAIPENNYCLCAHHPDELEEWKERQHLSQRKQKFAKQKGLQTFTETIVDSIDNAKVESDVVSIFCLIDIFFFLIIL